MNTTATLQQYNIVHQCKLATVLQTNLFSPQKTAQYFFIWPLNTQKQSLHICLLSKILKRHNFPSCTDQFEIYTHTHILVWACCFNTVGSTPFVSSFPPDLWNWLYRFALTGYEKINELLHRCWAIRLGSKLKLIPKALGVKPVQASLVVFTPDWERYFVGWILCTENVECWKMIQIVSQVAFFVTMTTNQNQLVIHHRINSIM